MRDYIEQRAVMFANYIIDNKATVRKTAKHYDISKSTVHKDIQERLAYVSPTLAKRAKEVLNENKKQRHIRGGMATKLKYAKQRECEGKY